MSGTLLLDVVTWDLVLDASGNIAIATPPYSLAQDVATSVRTMLGEVWYNQSLGVPYKQILGVAPVPLVLLKAQCVAAAETVPGVYNAAMTVSGFVNRILTGQIAFTDASGNAFVAAI